MHTFRADHVLPETIDFIDIYCKFQSLFFMFNYFCSFRFD